MNQKIISAGIVRAVLTLILIFLTAYGLYLLKTPITYLVIAAVVTLICRPLVKILKEKLKFSPFWATISVIFLLLLVILGILGSFIPLLVSQWNNLSSIDFVKVQDKTNEFLVHFFNYFGIEVDVSDVLSITNLLDIQDVQVFINSFISLISDLGIGAFSVIFTVFFFLKDGNLIIKNFLLTLNRKHISKTKNSIETIKRLLSRYFIGLFFQILIIFVILTITLLIMGVKDAFLIAFLCALLNLIPYLGPMIGAVLISILTLSNFVEADFFAVILPKIIGVLIGFGVAQLIDNVFSQPFIFSNSVKSHPLEIFLIILAFGTLFGMVGMVVAVPAYTVLKVILKEIFSENKFIQLLTKNI